AQFGIAIRQAQMTVRQELALDTLPQLAPTPVVISPREQTLYAAICSLFDDNPAWPGVLVLAFDSLEPPAVAADPFPEDDIDVSEAEKWRGPPAAALVALLF